MIDSYPEGYLEALGHCQQIAVKILKNAKIHHVTEAELQKTCSQRSRCDNKDISGLTCPFTNQCIGEAEQ